jgi:hypothetical protein
MTRPATSARPSAAPILRAVVVVLTAIFVSMVAAPAPASAATPPGVGNAEFLYSGVPINKRPDGEFGLVRRSVDGEVVRAHCYIGGQMKITDYYGYPMWTDVSALVLRESGIRSCGFWD